MLLHHFFFSLKIGCLDVGRLRPSTKSLLESHTWLTIWLASVDKWGCVGFSRLSSLLPSQWVLLTLPFKYLRPAKNYILLEPVWLLRDLGFLMRHNFFLQFPWIAGSFDMQLQIEGHNLHLQEVECLGASFAWFD